MSDSIGIVILAAGKGTRLKIDTPKPLCPVMGKTLVDYVISEDQNSVLIMNQNRINSVSNVRMIRILISLRF